MNKEKLTALLAEYFETSQDGGSYFYELTRHKSAFEYGTVTLNDFEVFTQQTCSEIAEFIIEGMEK